MKKSRALFVGVLIFAIIGSMIAYFISSTKTGNSVLSYWSVLGSIMLGVKFLLEKDDKPKKEIKNASRLVLPIAALTFGSAQSTLVGVFASLATTTKRPLSVWYAQVTSVIILSPISMDTPVSYRAWV